MQGPQSQSSAFILLFLHPYGQGPLSILFHSATLLLRQIWRRRDGVGSSGFLRGLRTESPVSLYGVMASTVRVGRSRGLSFVGVLARYVGRALRRSVVFTAE